ncbi:hypothetical protein OHA71_48290 [Streptomyces sp. NBC_00444]|uniref:hypothetical protein n=1 Tax=Streptomyces sp. NBC_00444 TaxID=2975744 RepID=UPI002E21A42B
MVLLIAAVVPMSGPLAVASSGAPASADTGTLRISAVFDDGSALPDTALVRINDVDAGATDASGAATVAWSAGQANVSVILPSLAKGSASATVVAGETTDVRVVLFDGEDTYEPSTLTMDELVNGGVDAATPSVTLRFRRESDRAVVPMASVQMVTLETPADPEQDLTALFGVAPDGAVVATDVPKLTGVLASLSSSEATLTVQAVDAAGLSYAEYVSFAPGLFRVTVALQAPPSKPGLPLAGVPVAVRFGTVDTTMTTDDAGRLVLDHVPTGPVTVGASVFVDGLWFGGAAEFTAAANGALTLTMRAPADVLAGVAPWNLTTDGAASADRATSSGEHDVKLRQDHAAARANTLNVFAPQAANVDATSAAENVPQVRSATATAPKGTSQIILGYQVQSAEYPQNVEARSRYNDTWGVSLLGPAGQNLFSISRSVNSQLTTPPIWRFDPFNGGITGGINQYIDVSALTADSAAVVTLTVTATNIGAPGGKTKVSADLSSASSTLAINGIRKDRVPQPATGRSDRFSIPRPGAANTFQRTFDVDYSKAANVTATRAKVELLDASNNVLQTVTDAAVGEPEVTQVDADTLRVRATFGGGAQSNVVGTPPPADSIRYRVTLTGQRTNGTAVTSPAQLSQEFHPLWRMPDGFDRYSTRDPGGDDWASQQTYDWLVSNRQLVTRINDISGEHGRNIGHQTHLEGRDIDLFHVYRFPNNPQFNGTVNFYRLVEDTQAALTGNAESRDRVAAWVTQTRARFSALIADDDVQRIYYAIGRSITGKGAAAPALQQGWARTLLETGSYTNAAGQTVNLGTGAWPDAGNAKMRYNVVHDNHFHLTLVE